MKINEEGTAATPGNVPGMGNVDINGGPDITSPPQPKKKKKKKIIKSFEEFVKESKEDNVKYVIEKIDDYYWLKTEDEDGSREGIEGFRTIGEVREFAKENGYKIEKVPILRYRHGNLIN